MTGIQFIVAVIHITAGPDQDLIHCAINGLPVPLRKTLFIFLVIAYAILLFVQHIIIVPAGVKLVLIITKKPLYLDKGVYLF